MNLNAYQLLQSASQHYWQGRQTFSKEEIQKKINEIKYLSAQKKVPRITLRKEIIHLENKLQSIFNLEQAILHQKRRESGKVLALKRQIQALQQRLATAEDKDLQKKVDRLTHLLGDYLAQRKVKEEVKVHLVPKMRRKSLARITLGETEVVTEEMRSRVRNLQERVQLLKQAAEVSRGLGKDKEVQSLQMKITVMEGKVQQYLQKHPELMIELAELPEPALLEVEAETEEEQVKHTILFGLSATPGVLGEAGEKTKGIGRENAGFEGRAAEEVREEMTEEDLELEKELPLPPPPKRKV